MCNLAPNAADLEMNPFLSADERPRFTAYVGAIRGAYIASGVEYGGVAVTRIIDAAMGEIWGHPVPVHDMFRSAALSARNKAEREANAKN